MDINRHYKEVKKVIKKHNVPGLFTISKYVISPYQACSHGCLYCDGRAEKYYVEGDFDRDIIIRHNVPELAALEVPKLREGGYISISSGTTDAYQPIEKEEQLTRKCLEVLADYDFPVQIFTKSALMLRDMDLISKIQNRSDFAALVSITSLNEQIQKQFEPRASTFAQRMELVKTLKEAGCTVGILAMPVLPYITALYENLAPLYEALLKLEVDFIMPGGLTLRPGKQKDLFFKQISKKYPQLLGPYRGIYYENRASGNMTYNYRQELYTLFNRLHRTFPVPDFFHHKLYKGRIPNYEEIFALLHQMQVTYKERGVNIGPLKKSTGLYTNFLMDLKKDFNRKRSRRGSELEQLITSMLKDGRFREILKNEKLFVFLKKVILEGYIFNPVTTKLET